MSCLVFEGRGGAPRAPWSIGALARGESVRRSVVTTGEPWAGARLSPFAGALSPSCFRQPAAGWREREGRECFVGVQLFVFSSTCVCVRVDRRTRHNLKLHLSLVVLVVACLFVVGQQASVSVGVERYAALFYKSEVMHHAPRPQTTEASEDHRGLGGPPTRRGPTQTASCLCTAYALTLFGGRRGGGELFTLYLRSKSKSSSTSTSNQPHTCHMPHDGQLKLSA